MNETEVREVLGAAAAEVLETMFFAEVTSEAPVPEDALAARLEFRGARSGAFTVAVERETARRFAASFLAADEAEISEQQTGEVVCEMANMFCGSVLSRLEPDAAFELLQPVLAPPGLHEGVVRGLASSDGVLALWISTRPQA